MRLPRQRLSRIGYGGLLTVGSLIFSFLLAEGGLRVWKPLDPEMAVHVRRLPDRLLGWRLEPNLEMVYQREGVAVHVRTNSRGFRDIDHAEAGRHFRVVILGDSFMEAIQGDLAMAFPRLLQEHLEQARQESVESINLGMSGFGTVQESLAFEAEGARFRPDLVLLGFYLHNDLTDNSRELEEAIRRRPVQRPYLDSKGGLTPPDFEQATRAYDANRRELTWRLWGLFQSARTAANSSNRDRRDPAFVAYSCAETPPLTRAWALTGRALDRLKAAVDGTGGALGVFSVPSQLEVDATYRAAREPRLSNSLCFDQPPGWNRLEDLLRSRDIPYIDLRPAFHQGEKATPGADLYWENDDHWNTAGHELASTTVARAVAAWKLPRRTAPNP